MRQTMLVGYARVSKTDDQDLGLQLRALKAAGCKRIAEERASGGRWDRPELHRLPGTWMKAMSSWCGSAIG